MDAREHKGKTLTYLTIEPDDYDPNRRYPMIVLLHGFGAHMGDLAGLTPAIDSRGYVYVCPNAPLSVQLGPGMVGYAWTPPGGSGSPEQVRSAEEMLATLLEEVMERYSVERGNIILGGFSQGGMMTYRIGLSDPDTFSGLLVLSARVSGPEILRARLPIERSQPIFISHGTEDSMISVDDAHKSLEFLEAEGYSPEYHEYRMGHAISQEVLDDAVPWIKRVLPPLAPLTNESSESGLTSDA